MILTIEEHIAECGRQYILLGHGDNGCCICKKLLSEGITLSDEALAVLCIQKCSRWSLSSLSI